MHPVTRRQEWMRQASDLLLKAGISYNLVPLAREAYEANKTPEEFVGPLFLTHSMERYMVRGRILKAAS